MRVYDKETDKYKSFTAATKKEAEYAAQDYLSGKRYNNTNMTLLEAIENYIASKENILSPSTIRGYYIVKNSAIEKIKNIHIQSLDEYTLQKWVNDNAKKYSPKSVRNQFGLVTASLRQQKIRLEFDDILLPKKQPHEVVIPTEEQIATILNMVDGTSIELAVTLAVTLGLRQSEISALKWEDYNGQTLKIHSAKVPDKNNKYIIKNSTKSEASTREIDVGKLLKLRLDRAERKSEYISPVLPSSVLRKFNKLCKDKNLPKFTMHAQRHGNASLMLASGVPDKYAMTRLGQSSPNMIKNVYQHLYNDKQKAISAELSDKFSKIYDTKYDTKI